MTDNGQKRPNETLVFVIFSLFSVPFLIFFLRLAKQRVAFEHRREAERTAQRIVEELLDESGVSEEFFKRAVRQ